MWIQDLVNGIPNPVGSDPKFKQNRGKIGVFELDGTTCRGNTLAEINRPGACVNLWYS